MDSSQRYDLVCLFVCFSSENQAQYSYTVIQLLMAHLDNKYSSQSRTFHLERTGIVKVLYHIVNIAASESVGPSVLDIFHSLLNHLKR